MRKIIAFVLSMVTMGAMAQGVIDVHSHIITPEFVSALEKEGRLLDEGFPLPEWDAVVNAVVEWCPASQPLCIGGIHDGIHLQSGDIALPEEE